MGNPVETKLRIKKMIEDGVSKEDILNFIGKEGFSLEEIRKTKIPDQKPEFVGGSDSPKPLEKSLFEKTTGSQIPKEKTLPEVQNKIDNLFGSLGKFALETGGMIAGNALVPGSGALRGITRLLAEGIGAGAGNLAATEAQKQGVLPGTPPESANQQLSDAGEVAGITTGIGAGLSGLRKLLSGTRNFLVAPNKTEEAKNAESLLNRLQNDSDKDLRRTFGNISKDKLNTVREEADKLIFNSANANPDSLASDLFSALKSTVGGRSDISSFEFQQGSAAKNITDALATNESKSLASKQLPEFITQANKKFKSIIDNIFENIQKQAEEKFITKFEAQPRKDGGISSEAVGGFVDLSGVEKTIRKLGSEFTTNQPELNRIVKSIRTRFNQFKKEGPRPSKISFPEAKNLRTEVADAVRPNTASVSKSTFDRAKSKIVHSLTEAIEKAAQELGFADELRIGNQLVTQQKELLNNPLIKKIANSESENVVDVITRTKDPAVARNIIDILNISDTSGKSVENLQGLFFQKRLLTPSVRNKKDLGKTFDLQAIASNFRATRESEPDLLNVIYRSPERVKNIQNVLDGLATLTLKPQGAIGGLVVSSTQVAGGTALVLGDAKQKGAGLAVILAPAGVSKIFTNKRLAKFFTKEKISGPPSTKFKKFVKFLQTSGLAGSDPDIQIVIGDVADKLLGNKKEDKLSSLVKMLTPAFGAKLPQAQEQQLAALPRIQRRVDPRLFPDIQIDGTPDPNKIFNPRPSVPVRP